MFASQVRSTVDLEDSVQVVIRKLSAKTLDKAREAKQMAFAASARAYGADMMKVLRDASAQDIEAAEKRRAEALAKENASGDSRFAGYDRDVVLTAGIVSWNVEPKVSPDSVADLDEPTAGKLFKAILELSLPPVDPQAIEEKTAKD